MKLNDILALINAGYTKAEIDAMEQPAPAPEPTPEPAPEPTPEPKAPAQTPPETEPIQGAANYAALEAKLNQLIGAIQVSNLNTGVAGKPGRTAADALGEIIAPPRRENK